MSVHQITESTSTKTPVAEGRPGSRLLANAGEMTLRVHASEHEPREVRIRSPKCTIGSAAGCTLRLRARGVGGLQCWILRGAQGSVVRSLHGSTTLNGARFDEAPVKVGDRLRIGPVELEVVECNQAPAEPQPIFHAAHEPSEEATELQLKLDEALLQVKRLQAESRQAFQSSIVAAERADQLRDALALANDQLEEMYKELAASEVTIEKTTTELEECRRQLAEGNTADKKHGVATENTRQAVAAAAKECERLTAELTSAKAATNKERESWNIERAELQRLIAQQAAELESARSSTVAQTCALTVSLSEKSSENEATQKKLQAKMSELEQQLAARQREIDSLQQQLEEKSAEGCALTVALNERSKDGEAARNELHTKLKEFERQLADKQHEIDSLQQQLDEKSSEGCAMTIAFDKRSTEDDGAQKELQAKLTEFEQQLAAKQLEVDTLQQRLDKEAAQGCAMTISLNERSSEDDTARQELQAKLGELEQQLAEKQGEIEALEDRLQSHAAVQHKLERLAAEFDVKCRELEDVRGQLASTEEKNCAAQQELDQQAEAILGREQALLQRESALADVERRCAQEQEQLRSERERLATMAEQARESEQQQSQLNGRAAELDALSAQLVSKQVGLDELRTQLEEERTSLQAQRRQFDQQRKEFDDQQRKLLAQQQAAASQHGPVGAAPAQPPSASARAGTVNSPAADQGDAGAVDSVLSRLVKAGLWREGQPAAEAEAPSVPRQIPEPVAGRTIAQTRHAEDSQSPADADDLAPHPSTDAIAPLSTAPGGSGSDEESIESYMERLMQRVRGDEGEQNVAGATPISPIAANSYAANGESGSAQPVAGQDQPIAAEPGEFTPRRAAPEVIADMSAMRDIANSAARSAIDRHVRKHTGQQATGRLFGACLTVALSAGLGYWAWKTGSLQAAAGAIIGGGLGLHWLLSAARRLFKLRRLNTPQDAPAETANKPN